MENDPVSMAASQASRVRTTRADGASQRPWGFSSDRACAGLMVAAMALGFVVVGSDGLEVSPSEARLALAANGAIGPLGQVFGYWAPDLWPGEVLPSMAFARMSPGGHPRSATVRWPSALVALLGGYLLVRGMHRALGYRAAICLGACWFGSLAIIDRSAGSGLDMILGASAGSGLHLILGVTTLAAIDRLLARGADAIAGLWTSLAFLCGGWPPLLLIGLVILVIGRPGSFFSARLVLPPLATAIGWSIAAIRSSTVEAWASAMTLPLTRKIEWALPIGVLVLAFPWTPFALLGWSRSVRENWSPAGRAWIKDWTQAAIACMIAGCAVPGLGPSARVVAVAGVLIVAAAGLDSAWRRNLAPGPRRIFFASLSAILFFWLVAMIVGSYVWILSMTYYRALGIVMAVVAAVVALLGWSTLASANTRRGLVTLAVLAAGLKLAHWGYYAPEWNYRFGQGPWGRAIGQWIPRRSPLYTFGDWVPPDLAFFIGRPVHQLSSPRFLDFLPGQDVRFVLLQPSEFENWPEEAKPLTVVARLQDQRGEGRILAHTPGRLPFAGRQLPSSRSRSSIVEETDSTRSITR